MARQTPEVPATGGNYIKFEEGKPVKLRIVTNPIVGYVDRDKSGGKSKPVRTVEKQAPLNPGDDKNQPKMFWAMGAFDYSTKTVKVLEITQVTIMRAIEGLAQDTEDFGDPTTYDLKITKTKVGDKVEYKIQGLSKSKLSEEDQKIVDSTPLNLEVLFEGGDPFEPVF